MYRGEIRRGKDTGKKGTHFHPIFPPYPPSSLISLCTPFLSSSHPIPSPALLITHLPLYPPPPSSPSSLPALPFPSPWYYHCEALPALGVTYLWRLKSNQIKFGRPYPGSDAIKGLVVELERSARGADGGNGEGRIAGEKRRRAGVGVGGVAREQKTREVSLL